jgi:quinone-modifying oxidoreductase subunit QmoA
MNSAEGNNTEHKPTLIIGGGMAGITAAVELAEIGREVILVEKLPYLGGQVARVNEYFPKLCPPYCGLEINFKRIRSNPRIRVITDSVVESITGNPGAFTAVVAGKPEMVTAACTACGDCSEICPVTAPDPFNYGMSDRKAIALPHELAFPSRYNIDENACEKEDCGKCVEVCKYNAINLSAQPQKQEIQAGHVIFCTGWEPYNAAKLKDFSWQKSPDILTNVMMERLGAPNGPTGGKILRPSDREPARSVAFIQCAGSRDENHQRYCSAVCCSASLKQALYFTRQNKENRADIFYIDLRVTGRNEDFLANVQDNEQIRLIKGKPVRVEIQGDKLQVEVEDILSGRKIHNNYDLVVLATGITPNIPDLAMIRTDEDGFIDKNQLEDGFSAGGCCTDPKDVAYTVRESTGLVINALYDKTKW